MMTKGSRSGSDQAGSGNFAAEGLGRVSPTSGGERHRGHGIPQASHTGSLVFAQVKWEEQILGDGRPVDEIMRLQ